MTESARPSSAARRRSVAPAPHSALRDCRTRADLFQRRPFGQGHPRREPRHQQRRDGLARRPERVGQDDPAAAARRSRQPDGGTIRFANRDLSGLSDRELTKIRAEEIGFVFQHFNLIPTLTAEENVAIAMFPNHVGATSG